MEDGECSKGMNFQNNFFFIFRKVVIASTWFCKRNKQPGCGCQESLEECGQDQIPVASVSLSPGMFHQVLYMH